MLGVFCGTVRNFKRPNIWAFSQLAKETHCRIPNEMRGIIEKDYRQGLN